MWAFDENFTTVKESLIRVGTVKSNACISDKAVRDAPEDVEKDRPVSFLGEFDSKMHYLPFTKCRRSENQLAHMVGKGAPIAINQFKETQNMLAENTAKLGQNLTIIASLVREVSSLKNTVAGLQLQFQNNTRTHGQSPSNSHNIKPNTKTHPTINNNNNPHPPPAVNNHTRPQEQNALSKKGSYDSATAKGAETPFRTVTKQAKKKPAALFNTAISAV